MSERLARGGAAALAAVAAVTAGALPAGAAMPMGAPTPAPAPAPAALVAMPGKYYSPGDLAVLTGTTVTWRNDDTITHTATSDADAFDSGPIAPGSTFARTFAAPGVYALHCTIHRFMRGVVRVYALVLTGPQEVLLPRAPVRLGGLVPAAQAGAPVVLEARRAGAGPGQVASWHELARTTAGATGGFSFRLRATVPLVVRARSGRLASPALHLLVAPVVGLARRGAGSVAVTTAPIRPAARVLVQVYDRERFAFVTRSSGRLGPNGRATVALAGRTGDHVRVVVAAGGGWSDGRSRVLLLR